MFFVKLVTPENEGTMFLQITIRNHTPDTSPHHILSQTTMILTHCGRVTQICIFNTVKLGTSASSP